MARPRLALTEGKLALTDREVVRVTRQVRGLGFADQARAGSYVSMHWNWVCEELTAAKLRRLMSATEKYIQLANQTL